MTICSSFFIFFEAHSRAFPSWLVGGGQKSRSSRPVKRQKKTMTLRLSSFFFNGYMFVLFCHVLFIFCFCLQLYLQVCRSGFSMHTKRARPCRAKAKITEKPRTRSTAMQCERPPPTAAKKKMKPSAIVAISLEGFCPSICRWSDLTPACPP